MSNPLLDNLRNMRNYELIGLAKNRFISEELQLAIADLPYRAAHKHLMCNSGLCKKAAEYLWSDRVNSGYSYKAMLIDNGHFKHDIDKYWELYERYPSAWNRSRWKMMHAYIFSHDAWHKDHLLERGSTYTPTKVLNQIFDDYYSKYATLYKYQSGTYYHCFRSRYEYRAFVEHQNCDLELAIKVSTCGNPEAEKEAFKKIVELS